MILLGKPEHIAVFLDCLAVHAEFTLAFFYAENDCAAISVCERRISLPNAFRNTARSQLTFKGICFARKNFCDVFHFKTVYRKFAKKQKNGKGNALAAIKMSVKSYSVKLTPALIGMIVPLSPKKPCKNPTSP